MGIDYNLFSREKVEKALLKFAVPAMISLLVMELYNMVDTFFVGLAIGPKAIGALTIAFPVQRLMSSLGMMIAVGASTAVARSLGKKDYKSLKSVILNAINITIIIMVILTFLMSLFKKQMITGLLGASQVIYPYAEEYISIVVIGGLFQSLTLVICYIMTSLGYTNITLKATSVGAILNIIIDYFLVMHLNFGIAGAAVATVVSQIVALVYTVYTFNKVKKKVGLNFNFSFKIKLDILKPILAVGFATFIIEISDAVVAVILNNILSIYGGDKALIIVGVTTKISMFLFITVIGISSAMQPIAAFNYGAKDLIRVKEVVIKTIVAVTGATLILWAAMMVFANPIIGIFLKDKSLLGETVKAFRIIISIFPTIGIYYVSIYYYQSMGKAKTALILSVYRQMIIFIPLLFILVNKFNIMGAWIAYPISDLIASITGIIYVRVALKEKDKAIEAQQYEKESKAKSFRGRSLEAGGV
ncbi:MATE family efflux transporter [Clostridium sp. Marseille-Q2269]|uniref:MATE family efflux transporter n=1 Tax=Clostridium sp. Marseille-Q2269 TaxID=2942205 RepID=UPI0020731BA9|nr:MATE family efflux transporter [Clostridium sp. Marseille-Q2269]